MLTFFLTLTIVTAVAMGLLEIWSRVTAPSYEIQELAPVKLVSNKDDRRAAEYYKQKAKNKVMKKHVGPKF